MNIESRPMSRIQLVTIIISCLSLLVTGFTAYYSYQANNISADANAISNEVAETSKVLQEQVIALELSSQAQDIYNDVRNTTCYLTGKDSKSYKMREDLNKAFFLIDEGKWNFDIPGFEENKKDEIKAMEWYNNICMAFESIAKLFNDHSVDNTFFRMHYDEILAVWDLMDQRMVDKLRDGSVPDFMIEVEKICVEAQKYKDELSSNEVDTSK